MPMNDSQLILDYLQRYPGWHLGPDMSRDLKPDCNSWAYRSRISCDLNKRILPKMGLHIESRISRAGVAEYRLVKVDDLKPPIPIKNPLLTPPVPLSVVWGADGQGILFKEAM